MKRGYIVASEERNPVSNLRQVVFAQAEIDRFLGDYVSLYLLSKRHDKVAKTLAKHLGEAGIDPELLFAEVGATFYRVRDVEEFRVPEPKASGRKPAAKTKQLR